MNQETDSNRDKHLIPNALRPLLTGSQSRPCLSWSGDAHMFANSGLPLLLLSRLTCFAWPWIHPLWPDSWGTSKGSAGKPWPLKPEQPALLSESKAEGKARNRKWDWRGQEPWGVKSRSLNLAFYGVWRQGYQDSSHGSLSAPGYSIHISHSLPGSSSRRAVFNLRNCTRLALRPASFCFILGASATVVPGGLYLETRLGQTHQHLPHHSISFCIRICQLFSTSVV